MLKKILVANRSEIACRIIKACKELGLKTVAVYSDADKNALHVQLADEAVFIGQSQPNQSYLNFDAIINAAKMTNADAIHPGYGFLAENSEFNQRVRDEGLTFIAPSPEPMRLLGSKIISRQIMSVADVPLVPGMKTFTPDFSEFEKYAENIGYPVLIKSSAGGGGKGMRIVNMPEDLKSSFEGAVRESKSAFGSEEVYLEKYIESPRHIEFQVAADHFGNVVHLFERECSIQRRHQKIIEETPSPALTPELRNKMGETAIRVIQASGYDSVGTVEFLFDKNNDFYFLEVNARIQVEHPITEAVTGIDLLKLQIEIANNNPLPFKQEDLHQNGHAIECRIYAEDADNNFMPSVGKILFLKEPTGPGIRYDSGIYQGTDVSVFYDPVLAKLITWGADREEARLRMIHALKQNVILGVKTSIPFMSNILQHEEFISGKTFTDFIGKNMSHNSRDAGEENLHHAISVATLHLSKQKTTFSLGTGNEPLSSPWLEIGNWEIGKSK